ncbi:MFS transporter [Marinobacterium marinum]|uniref:MFS transporter n=1 Tax=Marinobacterium marinum TaxID=2756129 RepID=A0A7W2ADJ9_9GAMM|nr:MFS transporter [Marinobacterium marinum]MBA4503278.1 MFS transporter [Marinobacterium marinum]
MKAENRQRSVLLTASAACALTIFDTNLLGVIMPMLVADMGVDFAQMAWVMSGFLLSFASLLLVAGALADHYGRKRILLLGLGLYGGAALASGLAPEVGLLIAARILQGAGAAFLLAPALAIIGQTFRAPEEAVKAWAIWGSLMGLTMVTAPLLSSLVGAGLGWRWALGMMMPICALLMWQVMRLIDESSAPRPQAFDWLGAALFSLTMLAGSWSLIRGPEIGWSSALVLGPLLAGAVLLTAFIVRELAVSNPMLQLRLFASPAFVGAVAAMLGYAAAAQVMAAFLPVYLQKGLGVSLVWTGVALLPFALAMLIFPMVGRRLSAWLQSWQLLGLGLAIIALGNLGLAAAVKADSSMGFFICMACLGAGGGLINGETQKAILGTVSADQVGMASGISTTARFLAMLIGYAGLSSVLLSGVRAELQVQLCPPSGCWLTADLVTSVAAGEWMRAEYEGSPLASSFALQGYQAGFSALFEVAAIVALVAVACVLLLMRRSKGDET